MARMYVHLSCLCDEIFDVSKCDIVGVTVKGCNEFKGNIPKRRKIHLTVTGALNGLGNHSYN